MVVSKARTRFRPGAFQTSVSPVSSCSFLNRYGSGRTDLPCGAKVA